MAASADAVADGLVQSLAQPGGNVTGRSVYAPELTLKRIELLRDTLRNLVLVGILWNVQNTGGLRQLREAGKAGEALGVAITQLETRIPEGLEDAMTRAARAGAGAVLMISDSSTINNRAQIGAAGLGQRLLTMLPTKPISSVEV